MTKKETVQALLRDAREAARRLAVTATADKNAALAAIAAAREALDNGLWKDISLAERKEYILALWQGILDKAGEFARLETLNTGKPIKESAKVLVQGEIDRGHSAFAKLFFNKIFAEMPADDGSHGYFI